MPQDAIRYLTVNPYTQLDQTAGTIKAERLDEHIIYVLESEILHADSSGVADALANRGDACGCFDAKIPGICDGDAAASTNYVPVKVCFHPVIVIKAVKGEDGSGNAAAAYGDRVYLDTDGELNVDVTNGTLWGVWLGGTIGSGSTVTGPVLMYNAKL